MPLQGALLIAIYSQGDCPGLGASALSGRVGLKLAIALAFQPFRACGASALLAKLFNIRYEDILVNLTIILMSHESERNRHYRARSKLALSHIAQHGGSILVLVLAAQLLQDDVTFHHLSVLTLLLCTAKASPCFTTLII